MGLYLSKPNLEKVKGSKQLPTLQYAYSSLQGWKIKQEDCLIIKPQFDQENSLFGIIQHLGADDLVVHIEKTIIDTILSDADYKAQKYDKCLENIYDKIDQDVKTKFTTNLYTGATLLLCLLTNENVYVSNIGLSRCILKYENKHKVMSVDHYPINDIEKQRILVAGGEVWENRVNAHLPFSRAFGFLEYKGNSQQDSKSQIMIAQPSVKYVERANTEMILLGSSGFWQTWTNGGITDVIIERVEQKKGLQEIVDTITDSIVATNVDQEFGKDNISCIIILISK